MHALGWTDRAPFALQPTEPFDLPQVISLALWGGVWGILMTAVASAPAAFRVRVWQIT